LPQGEANILFACLDRLQAEADAMIEATMNRKDET
jgi:hypothetical protein